MYGLMDDSPIDTIKLGAQLTGWEGPKPYVYDDANGRPIVKGYTVIGTPTIGIGRNATAARGLTPAEQHYLLGNDIALCIEEAEKQVWWNIVSQQPEPRIRAFVGLVFNIGIGGLDSFRKALDAAMRSDWIECAAQFRNSRWYGEVGSRAEKVCSMIETGQD